MHNHIKGFRILKGTTKARVSRDETAETEMTATEMLESGLNDRENLNEGFPIAKAKGEYYGL